MALSSSPVMTSLLSSTVAAAVIERFGLARSLLVAHSGPRQDFAVLYRWGFVARIMEQTKCSLGGVLSYRQPVALRHPQLGHPVQGRHSEEEFRGLLRELPRLHPRPKDRLDPKKSRLG